MYRTQILLEEEQHKILADIARQEKRSVSDVVARCLTSRLRSGSSWSWQRRRRHCCRITCATRS